MRYLSVFFQSQLAIRSQMMQTVQFSGKKNRAQDYFRHKTKTRHGEKREKGKTEVRGEIRGRGKENASYVRRKGSRQQK